jgi:hypothetical protein
MTTITILTKDKQGTSTWRVLANCTDGTVNRNVVFKFNYDPSDTDITNVGTDWVIKHQLDNVQFIDTGLTDAQDCIINFVTKVKATPSVTLSQYNAWLSSQPWGDQYTIRAFVFRIGQKLAEAKEITLSGVTETVMLTAVRNWIVATPIEKLYKVLLNRIN